MHPNIDVHSFWEASADTWNELNDLGLNIYRDLVNDPQFFEVLPNLKGKKCLDIGCGEGSGSRKLGDLGASVVGIDISKKMVEFARSKELNSSRNIEYLCCDASDIDFNEGEFDGAISICSMMDMRDWRKILIKIRDAIKKDGFFLFSITHPCFWEHTCKWKLNEKTGDPEAIIISNYFDREGVHVGEWTFDNAPEDFPKLRTPLFHRTLSEWINGLSEAGFFIEKSFEPKPSPEDVARLPSMKGSEIVPFFLILMCKKKKE